MAVFQLLLSWTSQAFIFLFFLTFIAFLGCCLYLKYIHMKYDHIPGPPRDSFFFGHTPTILRMMKNGEVAHDKFLEWAEIYGPVFRLNFLHYIFVTVSCPEATKEILMSSKYTKDKLFCKKLFKLFGQRFLGNGLLSAHNHEQWYKQRRIMNPAFSSLYLRGLMGTFNERAENLMSKLVDIADSKRETSMLHLFSCVTLDVIAKVAFGVDLDLLKTSTPFPKAIETCLKGMLCNFRDGFFQFNPKNRPFIKEVREACRLLRTTGAQWIHERKTAMENGDDIPKDILTQIIKSAEDSMTKEDEEFMLDNFVTFFIAGQETTANQLAFCIMELARHPTILEKQEVDDVIGMKQDISYDDLGQLIYLSQVQFSSYATGRMEKFFKDPLTFDPDRFHPDAPKPYYCYYPFSLGPRSCLGQNFAQMEAKVVMAKLLQRFDFTLAPGQTFDLLDTSTLRPKSGVVCTVSHRNDKK
uniref:Cytochrome P450, family 46, subfamily A, polypeptide 1, tandem duplicate 4 n=1 Tax=Monopterus albus TaxID=43700 RepID=A0A3Q3R6P2_MONAL